MSINQLVVFRCHICWYIRTNIDIVLLLCKRARGYLLSILITNSVLLHTQHISGIFDPWNWRTPQMIAHKFWNLSFRNALQNTRFSWKIKLRNSSMHHLCLYSFSGGVELNRSYFLWRYNLTHFQGTRYNFFRSYPGPPSFHVKPNNHTTLI